MGERISTENTDMNQYLAPDLNSVLSVLSVEVLSLAEGKPAVKPHY